jgi:hypothetical protein
MAGAKAPRLRSGRSWTRVDAPEPMGPTGSRGNRKRGARRRREKTFFHNRARADLRADIKRPGSIGSKRAKARPLRQISPPGTETAAPALDRAVPAIVLIFCRQGRASAGHRADRVIERPDVALQRCSVAALQPLAK